MSAAPWRRIAGATAVLTVGILAGRLAGLAREVTLAAVLGASREADIAVLVLTVPDVLTAFLLSGAVSAVLLPEFTRRAAAGGARATLRDAEIVVTIGGLAFAGLVAIASRPIIALIGPGLSDDARIVAADLLRVASLALPLAGLSAVATAYLQSHRRFVSTAAGTFVVNAVLVAVLALAVRPGSLAPLAVGIVIAGGARWLVQRLDAARVRDAAGLSSLLADLRRYGGRYGAAIGGTSALVVLPFAMRALASLGGPGDIAIVNYALRIIELPLGAFITVGSIAALPFLSELVSRDDDVGAADLFRQLILATQIITVPIALAGILAAGPIAALLYGRPAVGDATGTIAAFAAIGMLSLPAQGIASVAQAYLIARRRLIVLLAINGTGLVAYVVAGWVLVDVVGTPGVMVGYVVLHWTVAVAFVASAARARAPLSSALLRDMVTALALALAAFLVVWGLAAFAPASAAWTFVTAAIAGAAALASAAIPRYRSLPGGGLVRLLLARQ